MRRLLPASLFGRLTLILVAGLLAAQFATVWLHLGDRALLIPCAASSRPPACRTASGFTWR